MSQRQHAVLVGHVGIGAGAQDQPRRFHMARAAITKDDDLQQAGPT
jgi:hypothetical protein